MLQIARDLTLHDRHGAPCTALANRVTRTAASVIGAVFGAVLGGVLGPFFGALFRRRRLLVRWLDIVILGQSHGASRPDRGGGKQPQDSAKSGRA